MTAMGGMCMNREHNAMPIGQETESGEEDSVNGSIVEQQSEDRQTEVVRR